MKLYDNVRKHSSIATIDNSEHNEFNQSAEL